MRVFHFLIKTGKRALSPHSFVFQRFWHFLKYFSSNHNLPSHSLFSKCFSWFFYLGVHKGTGFFFFTPPLARDSLSRPLRTCLRLTEKRWKITHVPQIQASSMKLRVHAFLFLVFVHIKTNGQNNLFFITTSTFR